VISNIPMGPNELKQWRVKNGYTQSQLAEVLGVIPISVSRWERGEREIPSFLHLALKYLEMKGEEIRPVAKKRGRRRKDHGYDLQEGQ